MTKVINGKYYNTATATEIYDHNCNWTGTSLYRTRKGAYFFYHWTCIQGQHDRIEPCDISAAKEFTAEYASGDEYIAEFGKVEEA